jgi:hypothetical protein
VLAHPFFWRKQYKLFSDRIQYKAFVFATFGSEAKSRECQGLHDHKSAKLFFNWMHTQALSVLF